MKKLAHFLKDFANCNKNYLNTNSTTCKFQNLVESLAIITNQMKQIFFNSFYVEPSSTVQFYTINKKLIMMEIVVVLTMFQFFSCIGMCYLVNLNLNGTYNTNILSNFYSSSQNSYQQLFIYLFFYFFLCFVALSISQNRIMGNQMRKHCQSIVNSIEPSGLVSILITEKEARCHNKSERIDMIREKGKCFKSKIEQLQNIIQEKIQAIDNEQTFKIYILPDCNEAEQRNQLWKEYFSTQTQLEYDYIYESCVLIVLSSVKARNILLKSQLGRLDYTISSLNPQDIIYENVTQVRSTNKSLLDLILIIYTIGILFLKMHLSNLNSCTVADFTGINPLCNITIFANADHYLSLKEGLIIGMIYLISDSLLQIGLCCIAKHKRFISSSERQEFESLYMNWTMYFNFTLTLLLTYAYQSPIIVQYQALCIMIVYAIKGFLQLLLSNSFTKRDECFTLRVGQYSMAPPIFLWATFSFWSPIKFGLLGILCVLFAPNPPNNNKISFVCGLFTMRSIFWMTLCAISQIFFLTTWELILTSKSLAHTKYTVATYFSDWILGILVVIVFIFTLKKSLNLENIIVEEFNQIAEKILKIEDPFINNKANRDNLGSVNRLNNMSNELNC